MSPASADYIVPEIPSAGRPSLGTDIDTLSRARAGFKRSGLEYFAGPHLSNAVRNLAALARFGSEFTDAADIRDYQHGTSQAVRAALEDARFDPDATAQGLGGALGMIAGSSELYAPILKAMFLGIGAKTADKAALEAAQQMEKTGRSAQDIWNETGWFKGADDKWRFEISDRDAALDLKEASRLSREGSSSTNFLLDHPQLEDAYDRARRGYAVTRQAEPGGSFSEMGKIGLGPDAVMDPDVRGYARVRPETAKSTLLHELQHGVQDLEGFAQGGSPVNAVSRLGYLPSKAVVQQGWMLSDLAKEFGSLDEALKAMPAPLSGGEWQDAAIYLAREPERLYEAQSRLNLAADPLEAYRHLAGEVEARNVQTRMNMTPAERRARPPWETEDVPRAQQIVR